MHAAKTQLSKLVQHVVDGEEIVIARNGRPVARLVPERVATRIPGRFAGAGEVPDSAFFDPLAEAELALWDGEVIAQPPEQAR